MSEDMMRRPMRLVPVFAAIALLFQFDAAFACSPGREWDYRARMKGSLRNLVTAQESFLADSGHFAASIAALGRNYRPDSPATVEIEGVSANGWRARAKVSGTNNTCVIVVGTIAGSGKTAGIPTCDPFDPPARTRLPWPIISLGWVVAAVMIGTALSGALASKPSHTRQVLITMAAVLAAGVLIPHDNSSDCGERAVAFVFGLVGAMAVSGLLAAWVPVLRWGTSARG